MLSYFIFLASFIFSIKCFPAQYQIIEDNINIRTDSTVMSTSLGVLHKGEKVEVLDEKFEWAKIVLPERFKCYVYADYVKIIGRNRGEVTASSLNLRVYPSLDSPIIGKVKKDDVLFILKRYKNWYKVRAYPYAYGWVHKKFLQETEKIEEEKSFKEVKKKESEFKEPIVFTLEKIIPKLSEPDMKRKEEIHNLLIKMGTKVIPQLESYLLEKDEDIIYSLIYVIGEIGKSNPEIVEDFFSKISTSSLRLKGIYLDIIQSILQIKDGTPYFYLVIKGKLTPEDIEKAENYLQEIYKEKIKTRGNQEKDS
jgi:SH3-like domain-containing protein